ncbi:hypothetical protein [Colwellia sp. Arc7-D]|uniref:hypothetical protein n=1 Tax=Colwellia sp. Arc7-D TaxID=2161872 RepID=UPI000D36EAF9|nr:hypothetical protein [Colwellia sp. Arc7-D]AWB57851.1 hypothetical protein DBO93_09890 [Colwellia sp. Arc7-D]
MKKKMMILLVVLFYSGTSLANELAECVVTFNMLARTYEAAEGASKGTEELRKVSKILGNKLLEAYPVQAKEFFEKEIIKIQSYKEEELIDKLAVNFENCRKKLRI